MLIATDYEKNLMIDWCVLMCTCLCVSVQKCGKNWLCAYCTSLYCTSGLLAQWICLCFLNAYPSSVSTERISKTPGALGCLFKGNWLTLDFC